MAKGQGNQGDQKVVIDVTKYEVQGKKVRLYVLVLQGNRALEGKLLQAYIGEDLVTPGSFRTDQNGRASILTVDLSSGSNTLDLQIVGEKWRQSVVVDITGEKKNSPFLFIKPNRIKNNLWFTISGSRGSQFTVQDSKTSEESKTITLEGVYRYPLTGFISLLPGEEYEITVTLLAEEALPFSETFRGYEDQPIRNRQDNWLEILRGFFSTNWGKISFGFLVLLFLTIVITPFVPEVAFLASGAESLILLVNLSLFFTSIILSVFWMPKIDGRLNNWVWFGWIFWMLLTAWLAYSLPSGKGLYEQATQDFWGSDGIVAMNRVSDEFLAKKPAILGSWLWLKLFLISCLEVVLFLPFAYWDEFRGAKNRFWEIYQQRVRKIQPVTKSSAASSGTSSDSSQNIFTKFWNGIKNEMDSALLAAGVTEAAMFFARSISRRQ
ncbi:hypothetical protein KBB41_02340 [Candidatus Curtissbacteria bacterium]|nr:hypothetical protein [Candidatus Curtissbacteria bacterium]